jgi:hypothetical protein
MKQGESAIPSNVEPAKTKYTNLGQKKMPWKSEGMEQYNQLHEGMWRQSRIESFTVKLYVLLDAPLLAID